MDVRLLKLRPVAGMFSNVNEVVQQLYLAEQGGYQFVIDGSESCYRYAYLEQDPWEYYFEPCFSLSAADIASLQVLPNGAEVACARDNIITPRLIDGQCTPLLLPQDRALPNRIIEQYIKIREPIQIIVNQFVEQHFSSHVIGLHIRGPGRIDGGASGQRSHLPCKNGVPFEQYFHFIDVRLEQFPESKLFACSDSSFVMMEIAKRYGDRVVTYNSTRSPFGEMHIPNHPQNAGQSFSPYKLGEDVLVEASLLARTHYLVHGNSNVINFVICKNTCLDHVDVYEKEAVL